MKRPDGVDVARKPVGKIGFVDRMREPAGSFGQRPGPARRNEPGGLARALRYFEEEGVNLTMITSRPAKHTPWEYVQFVDLQGHISQEPVQRALAKLKEHCISVTMLGSYPEA